MKTPEIEYVAFGDLENKGSSIKRIRFLEKDHNQGYEFENGPVTIGTITATEVELRWQIKTLEWEIERLKKENEILLETLQEELKKCK